MCLILTIGLSSVVAQPTKEKTKKEKEDEIGNKILEDFINRKSYIRDGLTSISSPFRNLIIALRSFEMVEMVKYGATGRRKSSIARVNLIPGTGKIRVNKRPFENYFLRETDRINILEPLNITNTLNKFDIEVKVTGGGSTGQAGAFRMGLARALIKFDEDTKSILKKALMLRRDARMKERKKPGQKGARRKFQWVKR